MKNFKYSNKWKTDPRAAFIPPGIFVSLFLIAFVLASPAWSFETNHDHYSVSADAAYTSNSPSPTKVDSCLPLLKSIHTLPPSTSDRNRRTAGKAAALGLVIGVRFALSPTTATTAQGPRLGVWRTKSVNAPDRSALTISAYRECQKEQALKALTEDFRWAR